MRWFLLAGCWVTDKDLDGAMAPERTLEEVQASMIVIEPGSFLMGCTSGQGICTAIAEPHDATLSVRFEMMDIEFTRGMMERIMNYSLAHFIQYEDRDSMMEVCRDCPVILISWHEAALVANRLSMLAGLETCYACSGDFTDPDLVVCEPDRSPYLCEGYRLPTETEWEYAARCGDDTPYAGSADAGEVAWYAGNSGGDIQEVGTRSPNACGLHDMSGNVWEWTQDTYGPYPDVTLNYVSVDGASERVIRGGAWFNSRNHLHIPIRYAILPEETYTGVGFRLVRSLR